MPTRGFEEVPEGEATEVATIVYQWPIGLKVDGLKVERRYNESTGMRDIVPPDFQNMQRTNRDLCVNRDATHYVDADTDGAVPVPETRLADGVSYNKKEDIFERPIPDEE